MKYITDNSFYLGILISNLLINFFNQKNLYFLYGLLIVIT